MQITLIVRMTIFRASPSPRVQVGQRFIFEGSFRNTRLSEFNCIKQPSSRRHPDPSHHAISNLEDAGPYCIARAADPNNVQSSFCGADDTETCNSL